MAEKIYEAVLSITASGISVLVTKKFIKNMYIRVLPPEGRMQITVLHTAADDSVRRFAISRNAMRDFVNIWTAFAQTGGESKRI